MPLAGARHRTLDTLTLSCSCAGVFRSSVFRERLGSDGTRVGQNRGCDRMLRCGAPFFCAGPVRYVNTCVHAKFEANLCTWAPSRTVDVSRFRVGRRAATAGGDRVAAVRSPPLGGGHRLRSPPVAAYTQIPPVAEAVAARGGGGRRHRRRRSPPRRSPLRPPPRGGGDRCGRRLF